MSPGETASPETGSEAKGNSRKRWIRALKLVLAVALLSWVAQRLPWSDSLLWYQGETVLEAEGKILGGWRSERIEFEFDAGGEIAPEWPEEAADAAAAGRALDVSRRAGADPAAVGYEWRPGMPRVFLDLKLVGIFAAFAGLLFAACFGVTRWQRLLRLADCPSTWWNTLRLTFLGLFFNLVMPGLTGGDLPKALLVVREHPERRAAALATVVIDRLIGLWTLIALATVVIWVGGEVFHPLRWPSAGFLVVATVGMVFLLLPGPRRLLGLDRLIEKLPQAERLKRLEEAALVYHKRPMEIPLAVFFSVGNHLCVIGAIYAIGRAFGDQLGFWTYVGIVPVANIITALPISPGGWGVGEAAFGTLFEMMGAAAALGVAVSVTYRLVNASLGLAGGVFLLLPGGARVREEVREEVREAEGVLGD